MHCFKVVLLPFVAQQEIAYLAIPCQNYYCIYTELMSGESNKKIKKF